MILNQLSPVIERNGYCSNYSFGLLTHKMQQQNYSTDLILTSKTNNRFKSYFGRSLEITWFAVLLSIVFFPVVIHGCRVEFVIKPSMIT